MTTATVKFAPVHLYKLVARPEERRAWQGAPNTPAALRDVPLLVGVRTSYLCAGPKFAPVHLCTLAAALAAMLICGNWAFGQARGDPQEAPATQPGPRPHHPRPGMPSLEQLLDRALDRHPAIVVARARAELAEAELNHTRLEVAREIIALRSEWEAQIRAAKLAERQLEKQPDSDDLKLALINARAKVAEIEARLRCLLGQPPRGRAGSEILGRPAAGPQLPRGPMIAKIRKALIERVSLQVADASLADVAAFLQDNCGVTFVMGDFHGEIPITLNLVAPLGAVLQAIEDHCRPDVHFVVRQYGILVSRYPMTDEQSISATDLWKQAVQPHDRGKSAPKRRNPRR